MTRQREPDSQMFAKLDAVALFIQGRCCIPRLAESVAFSNVTSLLCGLYGLFVQCACLFSDWHLFNHSFIRVSLCCIA